MIHDYTFILNYNNRDYVHQSSTDCTFNWALEKWIKQVSQELGKNESPWETEQFVSDFATELAENLKLFPARALKAPVEHVQFTSFDLMGRSTRLNIIETAVRTSNSTSVPSFALPIEEPPPEKKPAKKRTTSFWRKIRE